MIEAVDMAASGIEIESGRSFFGKLSAPPEFPGALSEFFFWLGRGYPILLSL